ncbi:helix-turn-helix transcriptional regulator [Methylobacter sp.]|uniref:helix-turn-helix transcriptional regulator n=1 Tax=Methylobacter sp. TaxID=2051955 RepID=UPI002488F39C|nr:helix-turn-helix transcriptional regulator [Methylobacter sp.]MDI1277925.1 helix-turn-helix transcriptional regulator [Methylobacter sp.]MDI1358724.1 helix-turn-helix transcriptional regulator [Methylobacter sp.]
MILSLKTFAPSKLLAPYVTAIWDYEDLTGSDNLMLSILPDTATYLCFLYADLLQTTHKGGVYTTRSGLAGFQSFRSDLGGLGKVSGVSARLTPWGLNVFRSGIVKDCAEKRVDCRDIFPRYSIEKIEDKLSNMRTAKERVQCVEDFLLAILNRDNEDLLIQKACRDLSASNGNYPIRMLARNLGLTERTFERRFLNHVGATPKKYARVVRLRNAIFQRKTLSTWADVACAVGYYDQSHMIHDFQELYGISPESLYPQIDVSQTIQFSGLLNLNQTA